MTEQNPKYSNSFNWIKYI